MRLLCFFYYMFFMFMFVYAPLLSHYMSIYLFLYIHFCFSVFIGLLLYGPPMDDSEGFNYYDIYEPDIYSKSSFEVL